MLETKLTFPGIRSFAAIGCALSLEPGSVESLGRHERQDEDSRRLQG
jgi:hypothetical protein